MPDPAKPRSVRIALADVRLKALLAIPTNAQGLVTFAHGSGSGRLSTRNQFVARELQQAGFATLLADLLTEDEDQDSRRRFDIALLTTRVLRLTRWAAEQPQLANLPIGYFGASTGAAAALNAAAELGKAVQSVISRGGRPDLATRLEHVTAPTLLIVGGDDGPVLDLHRPLLSQFRCQKELKIITGASHLFEEPGTLEQVADLAIQWFQDTLTAQSNTAS